MAGQHTHPSLSALRKLEASVHMDLLERAASARDKAPDLAPAVPGRSARQLLGPDYWRVRLLSWWLRLRRVAYVAGALGVIVLLAMAALWWRLGDGPIELDLASPWLTAAIEENFGSGHQVEVG